MLVTSEISQRRVAVFRLTDMKRCDRQGSPASNDVHRVHSWRSGSPKETWLTFGRGSAAYHIVGSDDM
jgi:hypothetical protein